MGTQKGWAGYYLDGKCNLGQGRYASEVEAIRIEKYDTEFGLTLHADIHPRFFNPTRIYMGYVKGVIFKDVRKSNGDKVVNLANAYSYWSDEKQTHVITEIFVCGFPVWKSTNKTIERYPHKNPGYSLNPKFFPDPDVDITGFKTSADVERIREADK